MSSTLTLSAGSGDCWADTAGNFDSTDTNLFIGATDISDRSPRTWIPFTVNLSKGTTVLSATLTLIASATSSSVTSTIRVGCEAADNPSTPTTKADLFARSMTAAYGDVTLLQYINGSSYPYDVTSAVQEVLNRSGWVYGNTLAVMIWDVDTTDKTHQVTSNEGGANKPVLSITVPSYVPRGGGWW